MPFKVTVAKLSGSPDQSGWSQVYDFEFQDPEKIRTRGRLFALISKRSQGGELDNVVAGREVLTRLHEEYFGKIEDKPFLALKKAVNKVTNEFSSEEGAEIAAVSVVETTVFIAVGGSVSVYLFRNGSLHRILEGVHEQTKTASGKLTDNDLLVVATKHFFNLFSINEIESYFKKGDPNWVVESLAPIVYAEENAGRNAVLILHFDENNKEKMISPIVLRDDKPVAVAKNDNLPVNKFALAKTGQKVLRIFKKPPGKDVYLKNTEPNQIVQRKGKTSLSVGILLLFILAVSIYFGIQRKRKMDFESTYESQLASAEHELQESYNLYLLNPQRSRELFDQSRNKVLGLSSQGIDDLNLEGLKQKIKEGEERILGQFSVVLQLYVDLALFSEGFNADEISVSSGKTYILDGTGKKIVEVDFSNKRTQIYAGPSDVKDSKTITAYSGRVFVSGTDGLYELNNGRIEIDDSNMYDTLIGAFAGNIYVLDKSDSEIYRYPATDNGFGTKKAWLREDVEVDLSVAKTMKIDGTIWVLAGENKLYKFSLGNLVNFDFGGVFPEIENLTDFYTDEESEYLYVLEKEKGRVVVTDKEGVYKAQYLGDVIKEARKIVVSEKEKRVFLVTSDKIFFFNIKHLL